MLQLRIGKPAHVAARNAQGNFLAHQHCSGRFELDAVVGERAHAAVAHRAVGGMTGQLFLVGVVGEGDGAVAPVAVGRAAGFVQLTDMFEAHSCGSRAGSLHFEGDRNTRLHTHFLVEHTKERIATAFLQPQHRGPVAALFAGVGFYALPYARQ